MDPTILISVWSIVTSVVTIGAAIAAFTKTPVDDGFWKTARKYVDLVALNFGHASNKDAE